MSSPSLAASRSLWVRLGRMDPRYPVSFLITLILVLGEARYGILGGYERLVLPLRVFLGPQLAPAPPVQGSVPDRQNGLITRLNAAPFVQPRVGTFLTLRPVPLI